jgi:histidinol-phosphate aminotransferase
MTDALERIAWYGDPESHLLRAELARHHAVTPANLTVGSGIDDLLGLVVRTFLDPGETAVTSLGAYPTFNYHVAGYGGVLHRVPYRHDHNDLEALGNAAVRTRARLVYLANPDNPTGTWHNADAIRNFLSRLPPRCLLLLDEAYADFAPPEAILPIEADNPHLIRMRTFSKAHGLAGARIGYALAAPETIAAFDKIRLHFGVNLVAQAGAVASLQDAAFVQGVVAATAEGRREYARLAEKLGLKTLPSTTNFVAIDVGGTDRARALLETLLAHDTFVRMPGAPPLNRCIRVSVGIPSDRLAFAEVFESVLKTVPARITARASSERNRKQLPSRGLIMPLYVAQLGKMEVVLRGIQESDVPRLVGYWHETELDYLRSLGVDLRKLGPREETERRFRASLQPPALDGGRVTLVAESHWEVLAYSNLNIRSAKRAVAHFHVLKPGLYSKAAAYLLFPHVIEAFFASFPGPTITMETAPENKAIHRLLQSFGLVPQRCFLEQPDGMARSGEFDVYEIARAALPEMKRSKRRAPGGLPDPAEPLADEPS